MAPDDIDKAREEERALERALPGLLNKLEALREELPESERAVLDEILVSAARHTELVDADVVSKPQQFMRYYKPMSVHITARMRQDMLNLPRRFNIER